MTNSNNQRFFTDWIDVNPQVPLKSGSIYSFVEMKDLNENLKFAYPSSLRKLSGGARFKEKDTLFARITPCLENGKICQVKGLKDEVGFGSTEFLVFRAKEGLTDPDFVYYLSRSRFIRAYAEQNMIGTSGRQRVSKAAFENLEITLPPLKEQQEIAEILSAFDDKIELNQRMNETLEAIAQAIFKEWFVDFNYPGATGKLVPSPLGSIPESWEAVRLKQVADVSWGDTKTTKDSYVSDGFAAYSASGRDGYLPYYDYSRKGIVVSAIGAYSGKTWFTQGKWSCIKNTIRIFSKEKDISEEYLYLFTSREGFWPLRGSAQPFISQTDARMTWVIRPDNKTSGLFSEVIIPFFEFIHESYNELQRLVEVRNLLLNKILK